MVQRSGSKPSLVRSAASGRPRGSSRLVIKKHSKPGIGPSRKLSVASITAGKTKYQIKTRLLVSISEHLDTLPIPILERLYRRRAQIAGLVLDDHRTGRRGAEVRSPTGPQHTQAEPEVETLRGSGLTSATPENRQALQTALAEARQRGEATVAAILSQPDMLSADEIGARLGISRDTVHRKRERGEILGLKGNTRTYRFPAWQVTERGELLPGLAELRNRLPSEWAVYRFLTTARPELGGIAGIEALCRKRAAELVVIAEGLGDNFF